MRDNAASQVDDRAVAVTTKEQPRYLLARTAGADVKILRWVPHDASRLTNLGLVLIATALLECALTAFGLLGIVAAWEAASIAIFWSLFQFSVNRWSISALSGPSRVNRWFSILRLMQAFLFAGIAAPLIALRIFSQDISAVTADSAPALPGLLASLSALGYLATQSVSVWITQLLLLLLIVVVDIGPLVLCLALRSGPASAYDRIAEQVAEHEIRIRARHMEHEAYRQELNLEFQRAELSSEQEDRLRAIVGRARDIPPSTSDSWADGGEASTLLARLERAVEDLRSSQHYDEISSQATVGSNEMAIESERSEPASILEHRMSQWLHDIDLDQPTTAMIYLADESDASEIEAATVAVIRAYGLEVAERLPAIRGSWLRRFRLTLKAWAGSEDAKALLRDLEYAARVRLVLPGATIDEKKGNAVAALITSLQGQETAVIMIGTIMVLKMDGVIAVRDLNPYEVAYVQQNSALIMDPAKLLAQLENVRPAESLRGLNPPTSGTELSTGEPPAN